MKVRILSGNQAGAVVEMPVTEAEVNISTGFAEAVIESPAEEPSAVEDLVPPVESLPRGRRAGPVQPE